MPVRHKTCIHLPDVSIQPRTTAFTRTRPACEMAWAWGQAKQPSLGCSIIRLSVGLRLQRSRADLVLLMCTMAASPGGMCGSRVVETAKAPASGGWDRTRGLSARAEL